MQGFLRRRIPLVVRRLVTLAPALVVIAAGVDPPRHGDLAGGALVWNPVRADSAGPADPRHDVMGALVNRQPTTFVAAVVATVICCLNSP